MHFTVALLGLKFKYWHIIHTRKILLAVCEGKTNFLNAKYRPN